VKSDAQLLDEALAGDSAAFGQLVTKYQDRLYNTLVHVVGSTDAAHDAVQEAFTQAFVKLATFERSSAFYTWLYRIAFNQVASQRRRRRPTRSIDQAREEFAHEPVDRGVGPSEPLERQERAEQVRRAMDALGEEHRAILILREMDDCSYEQIAAILELPIGTIRSRLHRARMQLRDALKGILQEDMN
jgi:RNA polymerase sigma-70 factor (ECF subfamily)